MTQKQLIELLEQARVAAQNAYAPYSGFSVGAALLGKDGKVYQGCNVENASYSITICAERTALFKAVSQGTRDFAAIAIWVESEQLFPPCGACRQALYEFEPNLDVIWGNASKHIISSLKELLPGALSLQ